MVTEKEGGTKIKERYYIYIERGLLLYMEEKVLYVVVMTNPSILGKQKYNE